MHMTQPIVEMAKDLVMALIKENLIDPEDMQKELQKTHASLLVLKAKEDGSSSGDEYSDGISSTHTDWKKSIKKHSVECLICGAVFKQLSARHLSTHGLDPRTYRQQFGIPAAQPLSAKATTAMRRQVVQQIRPWEKAPTYVKSTEQKSSVNKSAKPKAARKKTAAALSR
jgi:predicted transcriptional regulator